MGMDTMQDLFVEQLADIYSAELQILEALPKMAEAAAAEELREAFAEHERQTREHVERLDEVIASLDRDVPEQTCAGMKGLLVEGEEMIGLECPPEIRDAALIAAAQRVEHYEIAAYGTVRELAEQLELLDAAEILDVTLAEEGAADRLLTRIAVDTVLPTGLAANTSG